MILDGFLVLIPSKSLSPVENQIPSSCPSTLCLFNPLLLGVLALRRFPSLGISLLFL